MINVNHISTVTLEKPLIVVIYFEKKIQISPKHINSFSFFNDFATTQGPGSSAQSWYSYLFWFSRFARNSISIYPFQPYLQSDRIFHFSLDLELVAISQDVAVVALPSWIWTWDLYYNDWT
mgnify:CR=1 FL=1